MDNDPQRLDSHSPSILSTSTHLSSPTLRFPDCEHSFGTVCRVLAQPNTSNPQAQSLFVHTAPYGSPSPTVSTPRHGAPAAQTPQRQIHKVRRMLSMHRLGPAEKEGNIMALVKVDEGGGPGMKGFEHRTLRSVKSLLYDRDRSSSSKPTMKTGEDISSNTTRSRSGGVRRKPSIEESDYLAIRPRVPGVFTPSLPPELWLLILRFSVSEPFIPISSPNANPLSSRHLIYSSDYSTYATLSSPSPKPSDPLSFLTHPVPHAHLSLPARQAQYNAHLKWKAGLTRVCRVWNWVGQEVLYEEVWIGRGREGRALAGRLCGDGGMGMVGASVVASASSRGGDEKKEEGRRRGFGWFGRVRGERSTDDAKVAPAPAVPTTIAYPRTRRPSLGHSSSSASSSINNVGRFIRKLHIETSSMEKCSPHDLLLILQHCPRLEAYADYRSVRRPMHPLALSVSAVAPFSSVSGPSHSSSFSASPLSTLNNDSHLLTPDVLLHTLLSRPLKHLTWTNYEYDGADYEAGVRFYEDVVAPRLRVQGVGEALEFLEVVVSGAGVFGMGGREREGAHAWGVGSEGEREDEQRRDRESLSVMAPLSNAGGSVSSTMLTELTARYTTTRTFTSSSFGDLSVSGSTSISTSPQPHSPLSLEPSIDGFAYTLVLPALKSLKVTLDNATFSVLSSWDMPLLTHLSVISADFGYAGGGFKRFFEVHGSKIKQLELGHSSGDIEEAWLTQPPLPAGTTASPANSPFNVPLYAWCPNLKEFICSADAEWNWQSPDWIAPHVLLPAHPGLKFIGVRDMERRVRGDADDAERRRRGDVGLAIHMGAGAGVGATGWDEDPYFMLAEQFGSLLRREAFPSLLYVRDMSWESDVMRRTGRLSLSSSSASYDADSGTVQSSSSIPRWFSSTSNSSASPFISSRGGPSRRLVSKASQAALLARIEEDEHNRVQGRKVLRFWAGVLEKCRERGVWLEDCRGVNVTMSDLRRAGV